MIEADVAKYVKTFEVKLPQHNTEDSDSDDSDDENSSGSSSGSDPVVIGEKDIEKELYLDGGVKPDWMS